MSRGRSIPVIGLALMGLALSAAVAGTDMQELDLGLGPDAVTRATPGYPRGLKPPHLREEVKRPAFMVPVGTVNLALYRPVTCSDPEPVTGDPDQVTDGIKKSDAFDYLEFGPGLQWVQVDLGETHTLYAVAVWHYYKNAIIYNDVIVRVSEDPEFATGVVTLFNNDHDNSSGLTAGKDTAFYSRWWGEIADARGKDMAGTQARYVRVYSATGMEGEPVRFVELAAYGI